MGRPKIGFEFQSGDPFFTGVMRTLVKQDDYRRVDGHGLEDHGGHGLHFQKSIGMGDKSLGRDMTINFRELSPFVPVVEIDTFQRLDPDRFEDQRRFEPPLHERLKLAPMYEAPPLPVFEPPPMEPLADSRPLLEGNQAQQAFYGCAPVMNAAQQAFYCYTPPGREGY